MKREPYNLSKDYKQLFSLLCENIEIIAFVTLNLESKHIAIFRQNAGYASLSSKNSFYFSLNKNSESLNSFVKKCKNYDLEYLKPQNK